MINNEFNCPNCGAAYTFGEQTFCSQCGERLPMLRPKSEKKIIETRKYDPRGDYFVLRFISALMIIFGILVIVISVFSAVAIYDGVASISPKPVQSDGVFPVIGPESSKPFAFGLASLYFIVGTSFGLGMIASGELIKVILDIRDDTRLSLYKQ